MDKATTKYKTNTYEYENTFLIHKLYDDFENVILDENPNTFNSLIVNMSFVSTLTKLLNRGNFMQNISESVLLEVIDILNISIEIKRLYMKDKTNPSYIKTKRKIIDFRIGKAKEIIKEISSIINKIETEKEQRLYWLDAVSVPRYEGDNEVFLEECTVEDEEGINIEVMKYLVLENEFVEIISDLLTYDGMSEKMIDVATEIIYLGICIKEKRYLEFGSIIYENINTPNIDTFDEYRAKEVLDRLNKKRGLMKKRGLVLLKQ